MAIHSSLTDPNIHEPKGASTASDGQVYVANGSGSGTWEDRLPTMFGKSRYQLTNDGTSESWSSNSTVSCRGKVTVSGISPTLVADSVNVSSVTRLSTGKYQITFTTAMSNANYVPVVMTKTSGGATPASYSNESTSSIQVDFYLYNGVLYDPPGFSFVIYGGL